jgi:uncharacterized protein YjbI with pentapeptide repeats
MKTIVAAQEAERTIYFGETPNLREADLLGADLTGVDLRAGAH